MDEKVLSARLCGNDGVEGKRDGVEGLMLLRECRCVDGGRVRCEEVVWFGGVSVEGRVRRW